MGISTIEYLKSIRRLFWKWLSDASIASSLAEEIISACRLSSASNAIAKKLEAERQADSSRQTKYFYTAVIILPLLKKEAF